MSQSSIRPLSVGNVVNSALVLYRSHLKTYFGISLRATLWGLVPFFIIIPVPLLFINNNRPSGLLFLLIPAWIAFAIYCSAKSITNSAVISRLAFSELVARPENVSTVCSQLDSWKWRFWLASFLANLIIFLVNLAASIATTILVAIPIAIITGSSPGGSVTSFVVFFLQILSFLIRLGVQLWIQSRLFIIQLPLAVENYVEAGKAISRSWELTKGFVVKIQLIILVALLITVPLVTLSFIPLFAIIPLLTTSQSPESIASFVVLIVILVLILIGLFSTLLLPFWQAIKAVIYYDLRSRQEGLDLQLRDRF